MKTKINRATTQALKELQQFVCAEQLLVLLEMTQGEEGAFFEKMCVDLAGRIRNMPQTYEQDGIEDPTVYLHYFKNGFDWFITEKDMEQEQVQAFGLVKMFETELGYISIEELIAAKVEIDLYFEPQKLSEVK